MTDNQRIGQLFLLGLAADRLGPGEVQVIQADNIGSVWFTERTTAGRPGVASIAATVQGLAGPATTGGVRFLVAANQEGGLTQALHGPGFLEIPSALAQGSDSPPALQVSSNTWAAELSAAGVNLNFAPVADVVPSGYESQNQPIGVLRRGYGPDPGAVGAHVAAFVRGMHQGGVSATLKHFPGLGRVAGNTDFAAAADEVTTAPDASFQQGIAAGADMVMVALARYDRIDSQHLAVFSPIVVTGLLRNASGFRGVVVSDDLGATAAVSDIPFGDRATRFFDAGGDLVVSKTTDATAAMVAAVRTRSAVDPAFRARLAQSTRRVLEAKQARGLLNC